MANKQRQVSWAEAVGLAALATVIVSGAAAIITEQIPRFVGGALMGLAVILTTIGMSVHTIARQALSSASKQRDATAGTE